MEFYERVDQVAELLRHRRRVTYRSLKDQFDIDEAALEALKDELFFSHPEIVDEASRGLVWTDETSPPSSASSATKSTPTSQAITEDVRPSREAPSATPVAVPDAERRQLTVMFCDLADSTKLSGQLDPEDLRDVIRAYQETAAGIILRYEGHIAQYLGDGLLVYFGWPQAHEDDSDRAGHTGLSIVEAIMTTLNPHLEREKRVQLAVRIGIHTGPVVVGEMGGEGRQENLATGETVNIASRLEGLAAPNQVVISAATRRLLGGAFDLEDLGTHAMKGVAEPMQVYGICGEHVIESRFEAATATGLTPLVGREEEIGLVLRRWEQATEGDGQVVLLSGEPGIGKSRLAQTVRERVAKEPHIRLRYQCSPYHINSAFYPFITQLERATQFTRDDKPAQKLDKLEALLGQGTAQMADVVPLFAALLAIPFGDRYPPLTLAPQRQKEKTIEALVDQLVGLAYQQPVLFIFEDAHWSDPTSLEVLDLLIPRMADARALVVITYRPEFEPPWSRFAHVTTHTLNRMTRRQASALVAGVTGSKALPDEVLDQIVAKTDGVPLFVEELTKTVLEASFLRDAGDHYVLDGPLPPLAIPSTLYDSLMARLDRLSSVKEVAQTAACIGREFSYDLLAAVSTLHDNELPDALTQLTNSELIFLRGAPPEATYTFKHSLVQDAAYESMLKSRRHQLHTKIAEVLLAKFPSIAEHEPELIGYHFTAAERNETAVPYWLAAGMNALGGSAFAEAVNHFHKGLELVVELPEGGKRDRLEINLQAALGSALLQAEGLASPTAEQAYVRARELVLKYDQLPQLFPVLWGAWMIPHIRGEHLATINSCEQMVSLAGDDLELSYIAHSAMTASLLWLGRFEETWKEAETIRALDSLVVRDNEHRARLLVTYSFDNKIMWGVYGSHALWMLGYPDQALKVCDEKDRFAQEIGYPHMMAFSLTFGAAARFYRLDLDEHMERLDEGRSISVEVGIPFFQTIADAWTGMNLVRRGRFSDAVDILQRAIKDHVAGGAGLQIPFWRAHLGVALGQLGSLAQGNKEFALALDQVNRFEERVHEAEIHRLKGELVLAVNGNDTNEAETEFRKAIDVAQSQQAKSWELRAAASLARLWQQQDKRQNAYDLLAPVYGWFTEGFETADLRDAKGLLDELAEGR